MKRFALFLTALSIAALACFAPIPVTEAVSTEPPQSVNTGILINISEPEPPLAEACTLQAVTDTNVRSCASINCDTTGDLIQKGEIITAACNQLWAYVPPNRGWVCVPAMTGTGGCNE